MAARKLTENLVRKIRRKYKGRWGDQTRLAKEFGVSRQTIGTIVNNQTWKDVK